jgi:hypothetical protein
MTCSAAVMPRVPTACQAFLPSSFLSFFLFSPSFPFFFFLPFFIYLVVDEQDHPTRGSWFIQAPTALHTICTPRNLLICDPTLHSFLFWRMSSCCYCCCCCLQVSCALWVLAEYSSSAGEVEAALAAIYAGLGPLPLLVLAGVCV